MNEAVACFIVNEAYLLPALVSAIQARTYSSKDLIDVVVYLVGKPSEKGERVIHLAKEKYDVDIIVVDPSFMENKPFTYGRLYIHKVMPENYKRIIYIDGDTQIAGSLDPLATAPLGPGKFMAARDPSLIYARLSKKWRKDIQADRDLAGYTGEFDIYFNAGILIINREGWPERAARAMDLYEGLKSRLRHFDQDLMNLTLSEDCVRISNKWNFPGFLIGTPMEQKVKPVIYHFMSNPRPWNQAVAPWGYKWMKPYDDLLRKHKDLRYLKPKRPFSKLVKYSAQQAYKTVTEYNRVGKMSELPPDISF